MRTARDHSEALPLGDLAAKLRQQEEAKLDHIVDTRRVGFFPAGGDGAYALTIDGIEGELAVSNVAHEQIAGRIKIPRKYYDRMRYDAPELLQSNVSHWFISEPEKRMFRTLDTDLRAVLSDRYLRLDNSNLMRRLMPVLQDFSGLEIFTTALTPERMYLRATLPRLQADVKVGDTVQAGVEISNSEVGRGALQVRPFILRLACLNGMVSKHSLGVFRRYHIGRQQEEGLQLNTYRDETLRAIEDAIYAEATDLVRASLSDATFQQIVSGLQDLANTDQITAPVAAVQTLANRLDLSDEEGDRMLNFLAAGGDLTQWGAINALTETAKHAVTFGRLVELEEKAGELAEMGAREWAQVAVPA